jgi:hypothetical protein
MNALPWVAIVVYVVVYLLALRRIGTKVDAAGARPNGRIDALASRVDARSARVDDRFDAVNARLDALNERVTAHLDRHVG